MTKTITLQEAFKPAIDGWTETLKGYDSEKPKHWKNALKRIFLLLEHGGLNTRKHSNDDWTVDSKLPIAALLDSGNRFLVQLPPSDEPYAAFNWLTCGSNQDGKTLQQDNVSFDTNPEAVRKAGKIVYRRRFATHDVELLPENQWEDLPDGSKKIMCEKKLALPMGAKHMMKDKEQTRHYGFDYGFHGEAANGENGHIYMHFKAPTATDWGYFLISNETSAPGKKNRFGKAHNFKAQSSRVTISGQYKERNGVVRINEQNSVDTFGRTDCAVMTLTPEKLQHIQKHDEFFQEQHLELAKSAYSPSVGNIFQPKPKQSLWAMLLSSVTSWFSRLFYSESTPIPAMAKSQPVTEQQQAIETQVARTSSTQNMLSAFAKAPAEPRPAGTIEFEEEAPAIKKVNLENRSQPTPELKPRRELLPELTYQAAVPTM